MEQNDLRLDSWYLQDRSIRLRVTHLPTGVSVEEREPDPKPPLTQRRDRLMQELEAKVDAIESGRSAG